MISVQKLDRLANHLQKLVDLLDQSWHLELHLKIDQSFYMQKIAELSLLKEQMQKNPLDQHLQRRALSHYSCAFLAWRKDHRKLKSPDGPTFRKNPPPAIL
ncbi:MAG: hypothetical protein ABL895_21820 [Cyclobacteriaceae bacterium]